MVHVALDAMGGDHAPQAVVEGAVAAVNCSSDVKVFLVGKEEQIQQELSKYTYDSNQVEVVPAAEVIEMAEPPVLAIRKK